MVLIHRTRLAHYERLQRCIGIIGTKPSIGATTTAVALAAAIPKTTGQTPLVIEGNIDNPKVHTHTGTELSEEPIGNIGFSIHENIRKHPSGFEVLLHNKNILLHPSPEEFFGQVLAEAKSRSGILLVPATHSGRLNSLLAGTNEILLVTDPSRESIDCLKNVHAAAKMNSRTILGTVVTKAKQDTGKIAAGYIERNLGIPVVGIIPYGTKDIQALMASVTSAQAQFRSWATPSSKAYIALARKLF